MAADYLWGLRTGECEITVQVETVKPPKCCSRTPFEGERRSQGRASGCESHVQPEGCRSKWGGRKSHYAKDGLPIFQLKIGRQ